MSVRAAKIHPRGHFGVDRARDEPLSAQIIRQLQRAIESGEIPRGAALASSRAFARMLGVSRNTVLTAYDELKARGLIAGRRGSGMRIVASGSMRGFDLRQVLREAQYPTRWITVPDPDGNAISVCS
jgi:GntR family transcriptional regulator/MocR family aminotransferase